MRVLIIEDEPTICTLLCEMTELYYPVAIVEMYKDMKKLESSNSKNVNYDVIISDIHMYNGDEDGLSWALEYKRDHVNSSLIIISADQKKLKEVKSLYSEIDDVLEKPFTQAAFRAIMSSNTDINVRESEVERLKKLIQTNADKNDSRYIRITKDQTDIITRLVVLEANESIKKEFIAFSKKIGIAILAASIGGVLTVMATLVTVLVK